MQWNFRSALKTLVDQPDEDEINDKKRRAEEKQRLENAQLENTSLRMERANGVIATAGMSPNSWAARKHAVTGSILQIERKCVCGTSYTFHGLEILELIGPKIKQVCPECKREWDFARDAHIYLVPDKAPATTDGSAPEELPREEALKRYEPFFTYAADHGVALSAKDYQKSPIDGNYWIPQNRTHDVMSLLAVIPSVKTGGDHSGPVVLATAGSDPVVEYEESNPDSGAVAFQNPTNLPEAWMKSRALAAERHRKVLGPEARLRQLDLELAEYIDDIDVRTKYRLAVIRDDVDAISQIQSRIVAQKVEARYLVGEGENRQVVTRMEHTNIDYIQGAYLQFRHSVTEEEAAKLLPIVEKRGRY